MPPEFTEAVVGWQTPGEYRGPISSRYGLHILKLLDYQAERRFNLEEDFDRLKEMARQDKTGRVVDKWIESYKQKIYISYQLN